MISIVFLAYIAKENLGVFNQKVANFCNDSFRTTLCLQYLPICIADSALFLVTIQMGLIPVNTDKSWIQLIDSELEIEVLKDVCLQIIDATEFEEEKMSSEQRTSLKNNATKLRNGLNDLFNLNMIHHPSPISVTEIPHMSHHTHKLSKDNVDITVDYPYDEGEIVERKRSKVSYATTSAPPLVSSYTIRNPPPIPFKLPASSPSSTPNATPPPPPPDTPSSSHQYTLPDTPNYQPPPPDTPSSYQETPAPPPPDTPSAYQSTPAPPPPDTPNTCQMPPPDTPAPPPPDTPVCNEFKIPDTPNTCQNTPAPPPPPDHHGYEIQAVDQAATPAPLPPPTPEYDVSLHSKSINIVNNITSNTIKKPKVALFNSSTLINSESCQNLKKQRIE